MKKALIAAAVAGAFAAPSLMAAELSTNIYWSQRSHWRNTTQPLVLMQHGSMSIRTVVVTDSCSHGLTHLITVLVLQLTCHLVT